MGCQSTATHGTYYAYRHGCRCPDAHEANRRHRRQPSNLAYRARYQRRKRQERADLRVHIDEIAVELACQGRRVRLTVAERRAAIERLDTAGLSAVRIADRLEISTRTVYRHRTARRTARRTTSTHGTTR